MSGETEREESGWTIDTLKVLHEQRFAAMDTALELKSEELSRRLDILNHAHEQAREVQSTYVPREVFEAFVASFTEYKDTTNRALILREGQSSGISSLTGLLVAFGGLALTVIVIIIALISHVTFK